MPCPIVNGTFTHNFCCSGPAGSRANFEGCCDSIIKIGPKGLGNFSRGAGVLGSSSQASSSSSSTTGITSGGSPTVSVTSRPSGSSTSSLRPSASQQQISSSTISVASRLGVSSTTPQHSAFATPPQPSHSQQSSSKEAITIGAGVGVPLGVLLVAGLSYLWYRERTSRRQLEQRLSNIRSSKAPLEEGTTGTRYNPSSQMPELEDRQRPPELHPQPIVEVANNL